MRRWFLAAIVVSVAGVIFPVSTPASAHHAEMCQTQAAKKFSKNKTKRVRYVQNCMAAHPHDRENAKR